MDDILATFSNNSPQAANKLIDKLDEIPVKNDVITIKQRWKWRPTCFCINIIIIESQVPSFQSNHSTDSNFAPGVQRRFYWGRLDSGNAPARCAGKRGKPFVKKCALDCSLLLPILRSALLVNFEVNDGSVLAEKIPPQYVYRCIHMRSKNVLTFFAALEKNPVGREQWSIVHIPED